MQGKRNRFIGCCLIIGLLSVLTLGIGGCSKSTTSVPTISSIAISPNPASNLPVGRVQTFVATGTYSDGSTEDISSQVTWSSDNTTVATIDSSGLATAVAIGTANITATLDGVTSPAVKLTVIAGVPTLVSIAVTPNPPAKLATGSTQQFVATGTYSDGSTADDSSKVTWASANTATATINSTGLATGVAVGASNITATLSGITSPAVVLTVVSPTSTNSTTTTTSP